MMSEKLKTIKELADELSVTKQNIQYHYQRLPKELQLKSSNGSNLINSKAEKIILGKVESSSKSNTKDQQISSKDQQIEKLTNLLDQQQRLALQDKKLLDEYKSEINDLKALKMPTEDTKEEQANSQPKEEVKALKFEIRALQEELNKQKIHSQEEREKLKAELTTPKKWYQFWK